MAKRRSLKHEDGDSSARHNAESLFLPIEMPLTTPRGLFEAVLSGGTAEELLPYLNRLPKDERELVILTLHAMRNEVAANCEARAEEIDSILSSVQPTVS